MFLKYKYLKKNLKIKYTIFKNFKNSLNHKILIYPYFSNILKKKNIDIYKKKLKLILKLKNKKINYKHFFKFFKTFVFIYMY